MSAILLIADIERLIVYLDILRRYLRLAGNTNDKEAMRRIAIAVIAALDETRADLVNECIGGQND